LLGAGGSDASKDVLNIIWAVTDNFGVTGSGLGLWEEFLGLVEVSANSEKHLLVVDIIGEVDVVDLIDVTLVHVPSEKDLELVGWSGDLEQVKDSQELGLGYMAILGNIEVLENWLNVDALGVDGGPVLLEEVVNALLLLWVGGEVFSSGKEGVTLSLCGDSDGGVLIDSVGCESFIHTGNEGCVLEESLGVVSLVFVGKEFKLLVSELEVLG